MTSVRAAVFHPFYFHPATHALIPSRRYWLSVRSVTPHGSPSDRRAIRAAVSSIRLPVQAGQVIGKVGYQTFDFALIDTAVARKGFVRPEQFLARHPWVLHTVDPFDHVAEPLRGKLLELNPRKVEPFGGRIDYDVDGRLVGNWYREGTGGFAGLNRRIDYRVGHLAIVPHYIDPTRVVISLVDFEGRPRQFQVKGNAPDPAEVSAADGVVKYELIRPGTDDRPCNRGSLPL